MTRRSGLGRGLDALLPADTSISLETEGVSGVPVEAIEPNRRQPRSTFDETALSELAASIAQLGILQPLLVREHGSGRYELVAGERRWRAARLAGLRSVPVVVVETDEKGSLERALVENVHRADLNPLEEAAAYKQLLDEGGLTQEALGRRVGKNRATIANALRLLDLPVSVQGLLVAGKLSAAHGKALLGLQGNPFLERLARRVAEEGMSVRDTEEAVRKHQALSGTGLARTRSDPGQEAAAREAQRKLADHLQTRVRVEIGKKKGKIVLDFVSLEELDRLMAVITGETPGGVRNTVEPF